MSKAAYVFDGATNKWEPFSGPPGQPGPGLRILGSVAAAVNLPAGGSPGDGWIVQDTGILYLWDQTTGAWKSAGKIKGDKGDAGETLKISGAVPTAADLPTTPAPLTVYISQDNSSLYIYDINSTGAGVNAPPGWVNLGAIAGPKGEKGDRGDTGLPGADALVKGSVQTVADLPATGTPGEMRLVEKTGHLYSWDVINLAWVDGGKIRVDGKPAFFGPAVPNQAGLPYPGEPGEARIAEDTSKIYSWNSNTQKWDEAGVLKSVPDGTADGQQLVWSGGAWVPSSGLPAGRDEGDLIYWDAAASKWIAHKSHLGYQDNIVITPIVSDGGVLVYQEATDTWDVHKISVGDLADGPGSAVPDNGDVLTYSSARHKWINSGVKNVVLPWQARVYLTGSLVYLNKKVWRAAVDAQSTERPGDAGVTAWESVGGATLGELGDVNTTGAKAGYLLAFDGTNWNSVESTFASREFVDLRVEQFITAISRTTSVLSITNTPVITPNVAFYIVGSAPTGDFVGHANQVAYWAPTRDGLYEWHFNVPNPGEAHLVENEAVVYKWDGAKWVKSDLHLPDGTANGDVLTWNNATSAWAPKAPAVPPTASGASAVVGTIVQSILTETQFITAAGADSAKWRICDGRSAAGTKYAQVTGSTTVPDLRGAYFRMAGNNSTNTAWQGGTLGEYTEDNTRMPRTTPFTTASGGDHQHETMIFDQDTTMPWGMGRTVTEIRGDEGAPSAEYFEDVVNAGNVAEGPERAAKTQHAGYHAHNISAGGDTETRPKTYAVNYFMYVG